MHLGACFHILLMLERCLLLGIGRTAAACALQLSPCVIAWPALQTLRAGGPMALYQGLLPNMLKVLPATSISYAVYDWLSK